MKIIKIRCFILLFLAMLLLDSVTTYAKEITGKCGDNLQWTLDEYGVMTISGAGEMWNFRDDPNGDNHECPWSEHKSDIKMVVFNHGITVVGRGAFEGCINIKQVTFSDTITSIDIFAFMGCQSLQNFTLPDSLTVIEQQAFAGCEKITKVVIPDNVILLGSEMFAGATALKDVYIGGNKDVSHYICYNSVFRNCTALEEIKVSPDNIGLKAVDGILYSKQDMLLLQYPLGKKQKKVVLPERTSGIMTIAIEGAVYMEELILPEGLIYIQTQAICRCDNLKYVTIPSTVKIIEANVAVGCNKLIYVENKSTTEMMLGEYDYLRWRDENGNQITSIKEGKAFSYGIATGVVQNKKVKLRVGESIIIPEKIKYANAAVPKRQERRDLIFISSNPKVATVDEDGKVVAKSMGIAKITIKNRYTGMEKDPVTGNMKSNTFEESCNITVEKAGKSISKIKISSVANQIYTGKSIKPKIMLKDGKKTLKVNTDYTISYKNNKNIGTGIITIKGKGAYAGTVTRKFSIKVKKDKIYTVDDIKYKIINPKTDGSGTVAVIGVSKNSKLTKITIADTVNIGGKNFKITSIGTNAFKKCTNLKEIVLGKNIKTIGKEAFSGDKKLAKITIESEKLTSIGKNALKGIKSKAMIDVPSSKVKAYKKLLKNGSGYKKTMKII